MSVAAPKARTKTIDKLAVAPPIVSSTHRNRRSTTVCPIVKVNLIQLLVPQTLIVGFLVLVVACVGKFVGAYAGARVGGLSHWEDLAMGSGMNARGAMEIIVATIGSSLGVLNAQMYSIVVMVAIVTSLMAPPLLRWTLSKVAMGQEESDRLHQEAQDSHSFIKQIRRVLISTSGGPNVQLAGLCRKDLKVRNELVWFVLL